LNGRPANVGTLTAAAANADKETRKSAFPLRAELPEWQQLLAIPADMRQSVDYLYCLYDALVSINVPNDKARAVVDAMERDMATTIATKSDLQSLRLELTSVMSSLATKDQLQTVRTEITELRQEAALIRKDMEFLSTSITVRLGSILMLGLGLLFAALKLT
jgi:hypothetical protein